MKKSEPYTVFRQIHQIQMPDAIAVLKKLVHGQKILGISVRNTLQRPVFPLFRNISAVLIVIVIKDIILEIADDLSNQNPFPDGFSCPEEWGKKYIYCQRRN